MGTDCNKEWTREFIANNFPKSFATTEWRKVREEKLFEQEKALLPATQGIVEERIEKEKIKKEIREVDQLIRNLQERRRHLEIEYHRGGSVKMAEERRTFVRACPVEDCRGYLSSQWKCGLCAKYTCPDCHIVKGDRQDAEHQCNPDDVATAALLKKDTKACPKCATGIHKIEGCDQMWCTQCHTAFSWKSGRIETRIHNPHFYEWQRQNNGGVAPRVDGDFACGRQVGYQTARYFNVALYSAMKSKPKDDVQMRFVKNTYSEMCRSVIHLQQVQFPNYQVDHVLDNVELRVSFLRNLISESEFKVKLQRNHKAHQKKEEVRDILHLFIQTVTDIVLRALDHAPKIKHLDEMKPFLVESNAILDYANKCLEKVASHFHSKPKKLRYITPHDTHALY
tara:strand:- start:1204 stop:2391 length:1188 start_codon:yes stop_codon:yes gene_type:complete